MLSQEHGPYPAYDAEADAGYIYLRGRELGGAKTQIPFVAVTVGGEHR